MDNALELAQSQILTPAELDEARLVGILSGILGHAVDSADLYFQISRHESWALEDGIVKEGSYNIEQGVGVRAISGEKTGFAYSDEIMLPALERASEMARAIARSGGNQSLQAWQKEPSRVLYQPINPLDTMAAEDKVALLQRLDRQARDMDSRIQQVMVSISGVHEVILVVASDGTFSADIRPLIRLNVAVIAEQNGRREQGYAGGGGRYGYSYFMEENRASGLVDEAVRTALINLEADEAPAGTTTVVLGPGWPGILLHEAIGHGLEGDFNRKGTSAFSGRIGDRVATEYCTVVDDGTLENRRGSLNIDDEGTAAQCTTLIENGVLKGYMQDKLNARLMGVTPTGNGRRESFAHLPMPRMTNTYMLPGPHDPEEIIASVDRGLYAVNFGGGQVDITSGKFVFSASEAYMIEQGKITRPVKGATLI
ncbi:MAG: metalloprotease TldD, partial [Gammaproteobacteria bacterium]|nr:metalloprotease TldD [Gammaproteobacteria bacterium]